jgi:hypothetical protein
MHMFTLLEYAMEWIGDCLARCTGLVAVQVPLERASGKREVTLDVTGYLQTNSYSCGGIAAATVVRYLKPRTPFGTAYDAVSPDPDFGTSTTRAVQGLRACGLTVSRRKRLSFRRLCEAIDAGRPVMVIIQNPGAPCSHWIVVYGYRKRPDALYIAGNNWPLLSTNLIPRYEFEGFWNPKGNGLICRPRKRRPVIRRESVSSRK